MIITQRPSPHHSSRLGRPVTLIVLHHTGGRSTAGTVAWFQDPESKVSAHYVVGRDGEIVQMVDEHLAAWHTGPCRWPGDEGPTRALNRESIGIELVNVGDGLEPFPPEQMQALHWLLDDLGRRHPGAQLVRHRDIAWPRGRKSDPADNFPWPPTWNTAEATESPTLRRGDAGPGVAELQRQLVAWGHPLAVDGVFGEQTEQAVQQLQTVRGLTVDGIVGPKTWAALDAALGGDQSND